MAISETMEKYTKTLS